MFEWKTGDEGWDEAVEDVLSPAGEARSKPSRLAQLVERLASHWPTLLGLGVSAVLIAVVLILNRAWKLAWTVEVGRVGDFAPGSVTPMQLPAAVEDWDPPAIGSETPGVVTQVPAKRVSPTPIFLVHDPTEGFLALYTTAIRISAVASSGARGSSASSIPATASSTREPENALPARAHAAWTASPCRLWTVR